MQSTSYRRYLKGGKAGTGSDKNKLKLHAARLTGDPAFLAEAVKLFLGAADLNTKVPHLEGEEIFGSAKH